MNEALKNAVEQLIAVIKQEYYDYNVKYNRGLELSPFQKDQIVRFNENIRYEVGQKYIKIITDSSVWGFISMGKDKLFQEGDILKAAGWNSPAKNAARGNVFREYKVNWTGPNYLR